MKPTPILPAILILTLFLTDCGLQNNTTQPPITTLTASPLINTPTVISLTPSPTDQSTQTPTLTPIPTLSEQDALETFINLIEKDSECNLPCWLGVTPGQTKFEEVENIFSQFSAIASTDFSLQSAYIRVFFPNFETAVHDTVTEVYPASDGKVLKVLVYAGVDPKGIYENITFSNPEYQKMWQRYFVPGIFTSYGPPEKIFLDTTRVVADTPGPYPFALWIVYPEQGFLIRYDGVNSKIGDEIRICPMQSSIEIKIWYVERSNYEEFMKNAEAGGISLGPQPIEEVTDFSIESFYEKFRSGTVDTCFETPASIWPH